MDSAVNHNSAGLFPETKQPPLWLQLCDVRKLAGCECCGLWCAVIFAYRHIYSKSCYYCTEDSSKGIVAMYNGSGAAFTNFQNIANPTSTRSFGYSLAISDVTLVVGAPAGT
jgi:hypothetical protein